MNEQIRLNKFLSTNLGVSRREADNLIAAGKVLVNGKPAVLGARIFDEDEVVVEGKNVLKTQQRYFALNKPVNYVCSRKRQGDTPTIYELLPAFIFSSLCIVVVSLLTAPPSKEIEEDFEAVKAE